MGRSMTATGQFLLATHGQFSWPPVGSFRWPLTGVWYSGIEVYPHRPIPGASDDVYVHLRDVPAGKGRVDTSVCLTAAEARELAKALIDAADAIERP